MSKFSDYNFKGQKALVRVDFNVPLNENFEVTDDTRMKAAVPTIKKILNDGGSVILMSHFGRPKNGPTEKYSLKHLIKPLSALFDNAPIHFAEDCISEQAVEKAKALKPGEILLLGAAEVCASAANLSAITESDGKWMHTPLSSAFFKISNAVSILSSSNSDVPM